MEDKATYPSFNALGRVAMLGGAPLVAVILIALVSLIVGVLGAVSLGAGGMLLGAVGLPVFIWCRQVCETDDQALRITFLEFWCWLGRVNAKLFGNTYTLAPMKYGRSHHVYQRYFAEPTGK
jgi:type IV secretion system protein VirB3